MALCCIKDHFSQNDFAEPIKVILREPVEGPIHWVSEGIVGTKGRLCAS